MPTFDYECINCGDAGEYINVPSNSTPSCRSCKRADGMKKLASRITIAPGITARSVRVEDTFRPTRGLEIIGEVSDMHCSCGYEGPGFITREVQLDNGRPSMN